MIGCDGFRWKILNEMTKMNEYQKETIGTFRLMDDANGIMLYSFIWVHATHWKWPPRSLDPEFIQFPKKILRSINFFHCSLPRILHIFRNHMYNHHCILCIRTLSGMFFFQRFFHLLCAINAFIEANKSKHWSLHLCVYDVCKMEWKSFQD